MTYLRMKNPVSSTAALMTCALLGLLALMTAPAQNAAAGLDEHPAHEEADEHDDSVRLDDAAMREFGIEVATAGPADLAQFLELPGEIQVDTNRLVHLSPRFSGIVTQVQGRIGEQVEAGQTLAIIESDQSLAPYLMKTLITGTIIDKHLTLGESVDRRQSAFVIADLSKVWADITVYQKDLPLVAVGQKAVISGGHGLPSVEGKITYISPVMDETTRTALARVVLPNPSGIWRPGTFITARIQVGVFPVAVAVPRTALQSIDGEEVVFVATPDGFSPTPVTLGRKADRLVEITAGLTPGQEYISRGGFTLKAELAKESFGSDHAH